MPERWFFGLWPDPATARALAAQARPLIPYGARPAHPLDLHLTLHFLGGLTPERVQAAHLAADAVWTQPFALRMDQAGSFPRARVLWCAPSRAPATLFALVARLESALAAQGFAPEARPFRAHLTLARKFRGPATLDFGPPVDWAASEFVLARGRDGQVPRYTAVCRWPLSGPKIGRAQ